MRSDKLARKLPCLSLPNPEPLGLAQAPTPQVPVRVSRNLFIGSYSATLDKRQLKSLGISAILNLAGERYLKPHDGFEYLSLKMPDSPRIDITYILSLALDFIERNISEGRSVMVHCVKGLSRAPTIACAYVMWKQSLNFTEAIGVIKSSYPEADPNLGFVSQLECFLKPQKATQDAQDHNSSISRLNELVFNASKL